MHLRTVKPHIFAGKRRSVGDEYKAGRSHGRLMVALGRAEEVASTVPAQVAAPEPPIRQWPYTVASLEAEQTAEDKPRKKRAYRRRDLTAEE